jgi:hypothetical protein
MKSVLYIFLPCKKVYPIGVTYLADFIHRRKPDVRQRILDLSLYPASQRSRAIREVTAEFQPDLVCFSWRDIQIFSPHEGDSSLEHAFNFYFASNPIKRIAASFAGLKQLYRYYSHIHTVLSYPWLLRKEFPKVHIMIGGGAFTAFADQLIEKLPEGTIGLLGEGEDAILKVIEGRSIDDERYLNIGNTSGNPSGSNQNAVARTTAPFACIPILKANVCATGRPKWSSEIFPSIIINGVPGASGSPMRNSSRAKKPTRNARRSWSVFSARSWNSNGPAISGRR